MRRWTKWMMPWAICGIVACAAPAGQPSIEGAQFDAQDEEGLTRDDTVDREYQDSRSERLTKWEKVAGHPYREIRERRDVVVNAYPPRTENIPESAPIYDPQEPDLCEDFYYQLCDSDADCDEGFFCGEAVKDCQPSACGCDPDTGDVADCTRDCVTGVGLCLQGDAPPSQGKPPGGDIDLKSFQPDLACEFTNAGPNPMSYCESGVAHLAVVDANSAELPPACHYEITVSSDLDGVVQEEWKWSGYDTYTFNHDLALQHLSLGAHDLCFDVVRVCDDTYVDTDGTVYDNPFAGITEHCTACLNKKFEVVLPELDENYCGMNEAQWHQEFMNGTHCIDASNNFMVSLQGTPENDLIIGNAMLNVINGKGGDDCIYGKGGPDRIDGNWGDDYIDGGIGNDKINGGWGTDYVTGGPGDDSIKGSLGDDALFGGDGRDYIRGDSGADTISGGAGDDELKGEWGSDVIFGNDGNDLILGGWGKDALYGESGEDRLKGGPRGDFIAGNEGRDFLMGDSGRDNLSGGSGGDRLCGNWGRDTLNGDTDTDRCNGGPGSDVEYSCEHTAHESACTERAFDQGLPELPNIVGTFCGVDAAVWLYEFENGAVGIIDNRSGSNVNINGTSKRDLILGNSQDNRIRGNGGDDCIYGYDGDDDIDGELGNDDIFGGNGNDDLRGGWGTDRIYGEAGLDEIDGDAGNDVLYGGSGNDFIKGGAHNDTIHGQDGVDTIRGDAGDDLIYGGNGNDQIDGELGNDTIYGQAGNDSLRGGWGNDRIYGNDGRDKLKGEAGSDYLYGGTGQDLLMGDAAGDRLYGEAGIDRLCGNSGGDYLNGGANSDACRGGWGSDSETQCESNASYSQCTDSAWNSY